jgi:GalNAc-alpha-(1->4)-GalNAc-alpha-(1->3)-diNAcBac-PP-undecaprenol alpha-1,4-N-acetyl-D-galactosaminyltransferase
MNMSNKKKICIVSPSLKLGGIERALTTLSTEFVKFGIEVHFVSCLKDNHFYKLEKEIILHEPNFSRSSSFKNKILFYPKLLSFLRNEVKSINPDSVLVFGDWFSPLTLLALLGTKFPVFISDRTLPNYKFSFPIPFLKTWLYPKSSGFIAQTQRSKDFKINKFGRKLNIKVIPNALPKFALLNEQPEKKKNVLYVGRFEWEKDPEILIRAFSLVVKKFPHWKLLMAGNGPLLTKNQELSKELEISNQIEFLGKVSDVQKLYSESSVYVLPSVIEGFPNSLIEAMSFGLPCICFADIPYEDIVENKKNGIVIFERSPDILAEEICFLIENENARFRLGLTAKNVSENFASDKISKMVLDFIGI